MDEERSNSQDTSDTGPRCRYFRAGYTDEPLGLMGGLIHSPLVLASHFFTVAFVAIWVNACDVVGGGWGLWKLPLVLADAVLILWKACIVFVPVMWKELL